MSNGKKKSIKEPSVDPVVLEVRELLALASLKLRPLREDYQQISWLVDDLVEHLDNVEAGELALKDKNSRDILERLTDLQAIENA